MNISGFIGTTLIDYPGVLSSIVFTQGCNFDCWYCHNHQLKEVCSGEFNTSAVVEKLVSRKSVIDGVVITGGEPTLQEGLIDFIRLLKGIGFKVKLDTNGSNPDVLEKAIYYIDYIAMDIKSTFSKYHNIAKGVDLTNILKSIEIIDSSTIESEFRTTTWRDHLLVKDFEEILTYFNKDNYYIHNYNNINNNYDVLPELKSNIQPLLDKYSFIKLRGDWL